LQGEPSGIFADTTENATGNGGNIFVTSQNLELNGDGTIISASTQAGTGGEITLGIADDIKLRNNSSISARAFNEANGGDVNIDTNFIVAFPDGNNDIIANANQGEGGNIEITAESLFGIEERPKSPITNDIDASSEASLNGTVSITTPEIDALRGATQLPDKVVEAEQTTDEVCSNNPENGKPNGLTVRGRGGLPATPFEPLDADHLTTPPAEASLRWGILIRLFRDRLKPCHSTF
jgi:large exoprotein involved in heme utilization and adhesion